MTVATMEETATVTLTETAASKLAGIMNEKGWRRRTACACSSAVADAAACSTA